MKHTITIKNHGVVIPRELGDTIKALLKKYKKVKISRLGTFSVRRMKAKKVRRNFSDGKMITIPAHNRVHFTPIATFNEAIN